jgi:uncharacterized protein DUF499
MRKLAWTPWHKVVRLRDDVRTGELTLAVFAADLYEVRLKKARPVYKDPREFFALTYPTFNLRELSKDVVLRLAGKNDKAIRQLELTYGGGKTHTLITLYHLVHDPDALPDVPAVHEFTQHIGMTPPKARVAVLPFDKLDAEKGMEVIGPKGELRWLKNPWSVLAFQIAGAEGLKLLHANGKEEERESAPAENLLVTLLSLPQKEDLATLLLIDEVLMFAREKVGIEPAWRSKLVNFFQYLTQAATKVDRCAVVASLLATDPTKSDALGKELTHDLYAIFRREREEGIQPVLKEDVAEVLRRRFFVPDSIRDRDAFRPHVVAALKGVADLDERTLREGKLAEDRLLKSYPFHPDLTEVLYSKWTSLDGFQRTRGVLRTFALALRDAERWDEAPLVGANVFIGEAGKEGLSEAARELSGVAATEEYEGRKQEWMAILEGEMTKARDIQMEMPGLKHREVEQAVFATFLHSQPVGQKALTRDLMLLLGQTRPDKIELEKALLRWTETSWFLDEEAIQDIDGDAGKKTLPKSWRLGSKPNLRQMHHDACLRIDAPLIEARLIDDIQRAKKLTEGASAAGCKVHVMPDRPRDIEDDGDFHFGILNPKAASESGKPSAEARRFIEETTAPDRPRVYKNAVVLVAPAREGLDLARQRIREYMGWEAVRVELSKQEIDPIREETLNANIEGSKKKIPDAIVQAYCIVVTLSDKNDVQAFKVAAGDDALFTRVKANPQSRIQETAITSEAMLPGGPYDLWREGETSRRVKDLVGAFAQFPQLPKMLNRRAILDTVIIGCKEGQFVLRVTRPDRSVKTFWRHAPDEGDLKEPSLEVVLPEGAMLTDLAPRMLLPDALPGMWKGDRLSVGALVAYFAGKTVIKIRRDGYDEPVTIPKAERATLEPAIADAVRTGRLWLISGIASILSEEIPAGLLNDEATLQAPPQPILVTDVLPTALPEAWATDTTTALAIASALSGKVGRPLPWPIVRDALDGAFRALKLERTIDSGPWPCDAGGAHIVKVRARSKADSVSPKPPSVRPASPGVLAAEAELRVNEIQDLAEHVDAIRKAAVGFDLKFVVRIEVGGSKKVPEEKVKEINALLEGVLPALKLGE